MKEIPQQATLAHEHVFLEGGMGHPKLDSRGDVFSSLDFSSQ